MGDLPWPRDMAVHVCAETRKGSGGGVFWVAETMWAIRKSERNVLLGEESERRHEPSGRIARRAQSPTGWAGRILKEAETES